jgi:L-2,4-diaminobutyrate decarboxylase
MTCPGRLPEEVPFDLDPAEMTALLTDAAAALVARIVRPADVTVATLDRTAIEALLPATAPRQGGGATRLRAILQEEFLPLVRDYRHPLHLGHQRPAPSFASLYADMAAAAFNPTVTMFEGGPYSVAIEGRVLAWMKDLVGYPADAIATLVNGGADANLTALLAARDLALGAGAASHTLRVLAGEHAHYTIARSLHVLGLPAQALIRVGSRDDLSIDPHDLARQANLVRRQGGRVMAIIAAAGATANGAFDDLTVLRQIADRNDAWLHVDAAHGGAALLSPKLQARVKGLAAADSLVINPHKMFFVSAPCSVLMSRRRAPFAASLGIGLEHADYVIPDPTDLVMTTDGDEPLRWTLSCTRFFSAFRLYAAISAYGLDGLARRVEHCCALAEHLAMLLRAEADFEILSVPAFNMLCFRYRPMGLDDVATDALNRALRDRLAAGPHAYLTGCSARGRYWLRAQVMSEQVSEQSLATLPALLRRTAVDLATDLSLSAMEKPHADTSTPDRDGSYSPGNLGSKARGYVVRERPAPPYASLPPRPCRLAGDGTRAA